MLLAFGGLHILNVLLRKCERSLDSMYFFEGVGTGDCFGGTNLYIHIHLSIVLLSLYRVPTVSLRVPL